MRLPPQHLSILSLKEEGFRCYFAKDQVMAELTQSTVRRLCGGQTPQVAGL